MKQTDIEREDVQDITVKLKRKIFMYFVIEVFLVILLLGFTFFLISFVFNWKPLNTQVLVFYLQSLFLPASLSVSNLRPFEQTVPKPYLPEKNQIR